MTSQLPIRERAADRPPAPTPERGARRPLTTAPLVLPALTALLLGLWGLTRQGSLWRDESVTWQVAHRPLDDLVALLGRIDAVHGLYYLLMHGVFALWDGGLIALRLPSVLATALAAAGVGALGARLAGRRAGVLAGVLFTLLPATQQYAQEGRSYALVTAGVVWGTYLFQRGRWPAYGVVLCLSCWLHEFAALALVAHGLTLVWLRVPRRTWLRWGTAAGAALAGVVPLAVLSAGQAEQQLGWLGRPGVAMWLQFAGVSALGVLLCRLTRRAAPGRAVSALALPLLIAPPGLLMTASLLKPWYVDRYVLYSFAGLALLGGLGLDRVLTGAGRLTPRVRVPLACLTAVAVTAAWLPASLTVRTPQSRKDDTAAIAHAVARHARPGDAVLFLPARRREWLMSYPALYARLDDIALARTPAASRTLQGTELPPGTVRDRLLSADRVIALTDSEGQPLDPFEREVVKRRTLAEGFRECARERVWGGQVVVYVRGGGCGG
ncbi:glycosyltransferase family 39 protein [Streptomyces sp. NPDC003688]